MGCSQPGPAATVTVPAYQAPSPAPATPSTPYKVSSQVYSSTNADLTIAWGRIAEATGYELQHKRQDGTWGDTVYSGIATSVTIPNLYPDSPYTVRVRACNQSGCSPWSAETTLYTDPYSTPSPAPTLPTLTVKNGGCGMQEYGQYTMQFDLYYITTQPDLSDLNTCRNYQGRIDYYNYTLIGHYSIPYGQTRTINLTSVGLYMIKNLTSGVGHPIQEYTFRACSGDVQICIFQFQYAPGIG